MRRSSAGTMVLIAVGLGLLLVALSVGAEAVPLIGGLVPILIGLWVVVSLLGSLGRIASALEDIAGSLRERSADRL